MADNLRDVLKGWDSRKGPRPTLIYTVTVGQNPTGGTQSLERRKAIYEVMKEFDLLMLEDDPYFFLQMNPYGSKTLTSPDRSLDGQAYLDSLTPSYLSIDTEGRVIHCDSFSKVIAPGCRAGWVTSNPLFIERLTRASEVSTQATSGFVQAFISKLLVDDWGMEQWIQWLKGIGEQYEKRRDYFCDVFSEAISAQEAFHYLRENGEWTEVVPRQLVSYVAPIGGMFIWTKIHIEKHPRYSPHKVADLMEELWVQLAEGGVLVGPG